MVGNESYLVLFSIGAGIVLLVAVIATRRRLALRKVINAPLTPAASFRTYRSSAETAETARPHLTYSGRWMMIVAVACGLIWLGLTLLTLRRFAIDRSFANEARTVTGTILSTAGPREYSNVQYEFELDGKTYRGFGDERDLRSHRHGGKAAQLEVNYLASDPTKNRPAGERHLNIFQGLLPCLVLALLVFIPARRLRRDLILARKGRQTTGIVIGGLAGRSTYAMSIYYDFLDDRGRVIRGDSSLRGIHWQAAAGSPIEVLFLPGNPERNNLKLAMYWQ